MSRGPGDDEAVAVPCFGAACPVTDGSIELVQIAHGGGGSLMRELIERVVLPAFGDASVASGHDAATLEPPAGRLAFTSDGYVVTPYRFPGGDIGDLAINGTVNDLAMAGARPLWISVGFVLEEGFPIKALHRVCESMGTAALRAGVRIVTGDTKVVERGSGGGLFVTTSGIGSVAATVDVRAARVVPGDAVILSGDLGRHGTAVMAAREGLDFERPVRSDTQPLAAAVARLFEANIDVHCLRDPTRGGLATCLVEIARDAAVGLRLDEAAVTIDAGVRGACEILGLDPFYVANEGRFVVFVAPNDAALTLRVLQDADDCRGAAAIGTVVADPAGTVVASTSIGGERILDLHSGEQLPRIC